MSEINELSLENIRLEQLPELAERLLKTFTGERAFVFDAPMGAGKTTLISLLCKHLGTGDEVASPSFAIVNVYQSRVGEIYHFDFYRIEEVDDAFEIGFYEYFDSGNYCFIEWPGIIEGYLPDNYVLITIAEGASPEERHIKARRI